jgi:hypothetical protein
VHTAHRLDRPYRWRDRDRVSRADSKTAPGSSEENVLGDLRFCSLLDDASWNSLPRTVRQRFSKRVADDESVVYVGRVIEARFSWFGWLLAQAARLIGSPFPLFSDVDVPSVVSVTEDFRSGGQIWTRLYARRSGVPQIVHSRKRFAGPTGLEEHVGCGVGMTLKLTVETGALTFRSARYFIEAMRGRMRFYLPTWASPGQLTVIHRETGDGRFTFLLEVSHPRFGLLIRQLAAFREA